MQNKKQTWEWIIGWLRARFSSFCSALSTCGCSTTKCYVSISWLRTALTRETWVLTSLSFSSLCAAFWTLTCSTARVAVLFWNLQKYFVAVLKLLSLYTKWQYTHCKTRWWERAANHVRSAKQQRFPRPGSPARRTCFPGEEWPDVLPRLHKDSAEKHQQSRGWVTL